MNDRDKKKHCSPTRNMPEPLALRSTDEKEFPSMRSPRVSSLRQRFCGLHRVPHLCFCKRSWRWLARFTRECERSSLVTTFYPCRHTAVQSKKTAAAKTGISVRSARRIERADSLNQENILAVIRKYFPIERHVIVTLMPEAGKK